MNQDKWMSEARRYSFHIYCYDGLIDDHPEATQAAFDAGKDPYDYVEELGEAYDLMRADKDWGINSDKKFVRA